MGSGGVALIYTDATNDFHLERYKTSAIAHERVAAMYPLILQVDPRTFVARFRATEQHTTTAAALNTYGIVAYGKIEKYWFAALKPGTDPLVWKLKHG